jgi:hypothetical protein
MCKTTKHRMGIHAAPKPPLRLQLESIRRPLWRRLSRRRELDGRLRDGNFLGRGQRRHFLRKWRRLWILGTRVDFRLRLRLRPLGRLGGMVGRDIRHGVVWLRRAWRVWNLFISILRFFNVWDGNLLALVFFLFTVPRSSSCQACMPP